MPQIEITNLPNFASDNRVLGVVNNTLSLITYPPIVTPPSPQPVSFETLPVLPQGTAGLPYYEQFKVTPVNPYIFSVIVGTLPVGMTLTSSGILSGIPAQGNYTFTVQVQDANGSIDILACSLTVLALPTGISPTMSSCNLSDIKRSMDILINASPTSRFISCGNASTFGRWVGDTGLFSGGTPYDTSNTLIGNNTPLRPGLAGNQSAYRYFRYGASTITYTLTGFQPFEASLVRIHALDQGFSFQQTISINGVSVQSAYVIQTDAGGGSKVDIKEYNVFANAQGEIVISFIPTGGGQAAVAAIEVQQPRPTKYKTIHCAGDSITAGGGPIANTETWVYQLATTYDANEFPSNGTITSAIRGYNDKAKLNLHNIAISGQRIDQQAIQIATYINGMKSPLNEFEGVFLNCGINDILQGDSLATLQARYTAYFGALTTGFKTGIGTITKTSGVYTLSAGQETIRQSINTWIRANSLGLTSVVDWETDARLATPSNTTYFYDGLHNTLAGHSVRAELVKSVFDNWLA